MYVICDMSFFLQFWNFKARNLLQKMSFESPITQILLHRDRYDQYR